MTRTNPIFNDNRMKIGVFCTNGKGAALTTLPEAYVTSWPLSLETARIADEAGFEAIVPYARWKGYVTGQPDDLTGYVMEPFTWAAGIAQATSYPAIFATSHAPTIHPILAAKQAATVDIISGGRFGLNVVGGWNKPELEMFGAPLKEHDLRYDHLSEWTEVVEKLWTSDREFDFAGQFFNVQRGASAPKPLQQPRPPIMNAGGSARGQRFACQYADMCFVIIKSENPDNIREQVDAYKIMAREEYGRDVQVWTNAFVVQRDSQEEAERYLHSYTVEHEDKAAADAWMLAQTEQTQVMPKEVLAAFRQRFVAGAGGFPLVGTAERINDRLKLLADCGIGGVLMTWVDYVPGMKSFVREVMPLMERDGLRAPFKGA